MEVCRKLRDRPKPNYKEPQESDKALKPKKSNPKKKLSDIYPIEVVEEDLSTSRVKVHYIGYSKSHDEWKEKDDIISFGDDIDSNPQDLVISAERFSLHRDLATKIKAALNSVRKDSPIVKIDMPFDRIEFNDGLRLCGVCKRLVRGIQHYKIVGYQDLDGLLGRNWHYRGLNSNGDFCFAIKDTVEFYLYHRRLMKEYMPSIVGSSIVQKYRDLGDILVFTFVKGNGTPERFGVDKEIF